MCATSGVWRQTPSDDCQIVRSSDWAVRRVFPIETHIVRSSDRQIVRRRQILSPPRGSVAMLIHLASMSGTKTPTMCNVLVNVHHSNTPSSTSDVSMFNVRPPRAFGRHSDCSGGNVSALPPHHPSLTPHSPPPPGSAGLFFAGRPAPETRS